MVLKVGVIICIRINIVQNLFLFFFSSPNSSGASLTRPLCLVIGWAHDIMIIVRGKLLGVLRQLMHVVLKLVDSWCRGASLSVNPTKTEIIVFTMKYNWDKCWNQKSGGQELVLKDSVKCRGIVLDSKQWWKEHTEHTISKNIKYLWQLRRAIGRNWGLKPETVKWVYESVLNPRLAYGVMLWRRGQTSTGSWWKLMV